MNNQIKQKGNIKFLNGKKILITGGAGYLASNLVDHIKHIPCQILCVDLPIANFLPFSGEANIEDIRGNVSDRSLWEKVLPGIDIIFHFAAQTSTYTANADPPADMNANVIPMLNLLEVCRQTQLHPVVLFSSTVTVTGVPIRLPVDESFPPHPMTIYDLHKLMAEQYLLWYIEQGMVEGAILRLANVYGPGPGASSSDRAILNNMVRKSLAGQQLTIYGKGQYIRDYIFVTDVIKAFLLAAEHISHVNGRYFIIGTGKGHSIAESFNMVAERTQLITGKYCAVKSVDPPAHQSPIEYRNFIADSHLFSSITGWKPDIDLKEGIDLTIKGMQ